MKKIIFALFVIAFILNSFPFTSEANEKQKASLDMKAPSAILIERDTGTVLFEKESNKQLPPASMTKIMTMILIMEEIDKKTLSLDDKVRTSERAASMGGSQIFLEEGEEMTVDHLLKAIAVASANDASVALAEHIEGSEEEFVKRMNKKVKELGLKDTHFVNSTGLPAENHYSSAHDMALMAKELLKHEEITNYTSIYEDYLREDSDKKFWLVNTNRLVKLYPGVDGLKTGYTSEAKYCLTATAKKDDMRLITVVMGAESPKERNSEITKMFDYAFSRYEIHRLFERGEKVKQLTINKGSKKKIDVVTGDAISLLTEKGGTTDDIKTKYIFDDNVKAPIKKGDQIGKMMLEKEGDILSETPLLAAEDIKKASWWQLFKRTLNQFTVQPEK